MKHSVKRKDRIDSLFNHSNPKEAVALRATLSKEGNTSLFILHSSLFQGFRLVSATVAAKGQGLQLATDKLFTKRRNMVDEHFSV